MENTLLLALSAFGFLVSTYVWYKHNLKKEKLVCNISKGKCGHMINSKYGKIFNTPLSVFGMIYFLFIFVTSILILFFPTLLIMNYILITEILVAGFAALFSLYTIFLQIFVIKELCEYCLSMSGTSLLIFAIMVIL